MDLSIISLLARHPTRCPSSEIARQNGSGTIPKIIHNRVLETTRVCESRMIAVGATRRGSFRDAVWIARTARLAMVNLCNPQFAILHFAAWPNSSGRINEPFTRFAPRRGPVNYIYVTGVFARRVANPFRRLFPRGGIPLGSRARLVIIERKILPRLSSGSGSYNA